MFALTVRDSGVWVSEDLRWFAGASGGGGRGCGVAGGQWPMMGGMTQPHSLFEIATATSAPRVGVIAELGVNHDGRLDIALSLVDAAAAAGVDAIKVQLFHPDRLLSNQAVLASYQAGKAEDARRLLAGLALGVAQLMPIAERARQHGLLFIATPFSPCDIEDLAELGVDAVKIASPDAVNQPLLDAAATLGRPMLISTGTCDLEELTPAALMLRTMATDPASPMAGGALLHCVSSYPTAREDAALGALAVMREALGVPIGYSDHTTEVDTGALAVAAGAVVLEKHLTHDKSAPGPDHAASLNAEELTAYVRRVRDAEMVMGPAVKRVLPVERDVRRVSRQSVCVTRDLPAGHVLTAGDLTVKRPGTGIPASRLHSLIGRALALAVRGNDLLREDHVDLA